MSEFKFSIEKNIGVISENNKGWKKELNIVKWGDNPPKYDIREWNPDHTRMSKGVTFLEEELVELRDMLIEMGLE